MNLLLDTHVLLWWLSDDKMLGAKARAAIANPDVQVFVSAASAWEISIKMTLGKLDAPENLEEALDTSGFTPLPITIDHALAAGRLPEHHRDPFDRMLIAQAQLERLTLVTHDGAFGHYDVGLLDA